MPLAGELGMLFLRFAIVAMRKILSLHGCRWFAYRVISFASKNSRFCVMNYDHYDSRIKLL